MTPEQEIDYSILSIINNKAFYHQKELEDLEIIYGGDSLRMSHENVSKYLIYRKEKSNLGYDEIKTTASQSNTKISLSKLGKTYLEYLHNEKEKEKLDSKLKIISIDSLDLNKKIPLYALLLTSFTIIMPLIIYFISRENTLKVNTETKEIRHLIEIQEYNRKQQKSFQDSVLYYLKKP